MSDTAKPRSRKKPAAPTTPPAPPETPPGQVEIIVLEDGTGAPVTSHATTEADGAISRCDLRVERVAGTDYYESPVCAHGKQAVTRNHPKARRSE